MIRFVNARRAEIVAAQEPGYEDCIEECPHCGKSSLLLLSHQPKRKFMACCTAPERIPRVPFDENLSHPYVPHIMMTARTLAAILSLLFAML